MKKMAVLMNHNLSEDQKAEALQKLGVSEFVSAPQEVARLWCSADPTVAVEELGVERVIQWLDSTTGQDDWVLVQGDYGLTFAVVHWCLENGRVPVYATTRRKVVETVVGGETLTNRVFCHVMFRRYIDSSLFQGGRV